MTFRLSLVAPKRDPQTANDLGFETEVIDLITSRGEEIGEAFLPTPVLKDVELENTDGDSSVIHRRKKIDLDLGIDYLTTEQKSRLEALMFDGRDIYINPNYNKHTQFSFPFQRTLLDISGGRVLQHARAAKQWAWDDTIKVYREYQSGIPSITFGCRWYRGLTTTRAWLNKATKPHPDSVSTGWTVAAGVGSAIYSESIDTPLLEQRTVTNAKGVTLLQAQASGSAVTTVFDHAATAMSGLNDHCAAIPIMTDGGGVVVRLLDSLSGVTDSVTIASGTPDTDWRMVRLGGANASGGTTASVQIIALETANTAVDRNQNIAVGPVMIASDVDNNGTPATPDWVDGAAHAADALTQNDSANTVLAAGCTLSFFTRYQPWKLGFLKAGTFFEAYKRSLTHGTPDSFAMEWNSAAGTNSQSYSNLASDPLALVPGQDIYVCVRMGFGGCDLFIGDATNAPTGHSTNGTTDRVHLLSDYGNALEIGSHSSVEYLEGSYLSHLRLDGYQWTDQEMLDHWQTFFADPGRGVVQRSYGRTYRITELELEARYTAGGETQWVGSLGLEELKLLEDYAPLQKQEQL